MSFLDESELFDFNLQEDGFLDPTPAEGLILDSLSKMPLFKGIKTQELLPLLRQGAFEKLSPSIHANNISNFITILVKGDMRLHASVDGKEVNYTIGSGDYFGPILGIVKGEFPFKFEVLSTSEVLSFSKTCFSEFIKNNANLRDNLGQIRREEALKKAREYRDVNDKSVRIAPRFSVIDHKFNITTDKGDIFKVQDISVSGLGIIGKCPQLGGDKLQFIFEASKLNMSPIRLSGSIMRVSSDFFGIQLDTLDERLNLYWQDLILNAMQVNIDQDFEPKLTALDSSLETIFECLGFYYQGKILFLGPEGAVLKANDPLASKELMLSFDLPQTNRRPAKVSINSRIISKSERGYLLEFNDVDKETLNLIERHLRVQNAFKVKSERPESVPKSADTGAKNDAGEPSMVYPLIDKAPNSVPQAKDFQAAASVTKLEPVCIKGSEDLFRLYFESLSQKKLTYALKKRSPALTLGEAVIIPIEIRLNTPEVTCLELSGKVSDIKRKNLLLSFTAESAETLAQLEHKVQAEAMRYVAKRIPKRSTRPLLILIATVLTALSFAMLLQS